MTNIVPTIGRVIWVLDQSFSDQPIPGLINYVHPNGTIDVAAFPPDEGVEQYNALRIVGEGETAYSYDPDYEVVAQWMPYQLKQAAKTEAASAAANSDSKSE